MTLTLSRTDRASVTYAKPASATPSATLVVSAATSRSWLTAARTTEDRPRLPSTWRVYMPTGTVDEPTTVFTPGLRRSNTVLIPAGLFTGTISTSLLVAKITGFSTRPAA